MEKNIYKIGKELFITSDEEIKEGDWVIIDYTFSGQGLMLVKTTEINLCDVEHGQQLAFSSNGCFHELRFCKKIILTTDQNLIANGVQAIDDTFLEWFIKNPSCEEVEVKLHQESLGGVFNGKNTNIMWTDPKYKIIIPKEEPKQETLEEAAEIKLTNLCYYDKRNPDCSVDDEDIEDHKKMLLEKNKTCSCDNCFYGRTKLTEQLIWQQERMYSEEDMFEFSQWISHEDWVYLPSKGYWVNEEQEELEQKLSSKEILNMWFEQFKKK